MNCTGMTCVALTVAVSCLRPTAVRAQASVPQLPRVAFVEPSSLSVDGSTGLFRMPTADVLPRQYWSAGLVADNADWNPGDLDITRFAVAGAFGATRSIEVFARLNVVSRVDTDQPLSSASTPDTGPLPDAPGFFTGIGDARAGIKWQLLRHTARAAVLMGVVVPAPDHAVGADRTYLFTGVTATRTVSTFEVSGAVTGMWPARLEGSREVKVSGGVEMRRFLRFRPQAEVNSIKTFDGGEDAPLRLDVIAGPALAMVRDLSIRPAIAANLRFAPGGQYPQARNGIGYQVIGYWHPGRACPE